jgi:hypothetical protein
MKPYPLAMARLVLSICTLLLACLSSFCQDSTSRTSPSTGSSSNTSSTSPAEKSVGFLQGMQRKSAQIDQQLTQQTAKYIRRLQKQEEKLKRQLTKYDSTAAKNLYASNPQQQYAQYLQKIKTDTGTSALPVKGSYQPYTDSLRGTILYLRAGAASGAATGGVAAGAVGGVAASGGGLGGIAASGVGVGGVAASAQSSLQQFQQTEQKFQDVDQLNQFVQQRKDQIRQYLSQYTHVPSGLTGTYANYNKELYYYDAQVQQYKQEFNDPGKMGKDALAALDKVPAFQSFMQKNSMLAGLFGTPGSPSLSQISGGVAPRDQIQAMIQSQIASGGSGAEGVIDQNMQSAQQLLSKLQNKLISYGNGGSAADLPENFTPNTQKTLGFLKRLEYGYNLQNTPVTGTTPAMSAIGLSLGYKLSDGATAGVGMSYQLGLGTAINHIRLSNQGIGLRSFLDIKAKGSLWITGGYEENYLEAFGGINDLRHLWQPSALLGLTKKFKIGKQTANIQLLYDFLATQDIPQQNPIKFRIGYTF